MVLEIHHTKLCVTRVGISGENVFAPKMGKQQKLAKNRVFWAYQKIWLLIFTELFYKENLYYPVSSLT